MPTFIPPTSPDTTIGSPHHDSWKLFRHYGQHEAGRTVWKDELGVWHDALYPNAGGDVTRVYDGVDYTATAPRPGLATAQKVYLGGHVHEVSDAEAAELIVAGYGSGLNLATIELYGQEEDLTHLDRFIASPGTGNPIAPFIDGEERMVFGLDAPFPGHDGGRRDFWIHDSTTGWLNGYFEFTVWPTHFGDQGGYNALPQGGICARRQFSSGKWRAITINNNIIFGLPMLNVGVWHMNEDGTGFQNRQFGYDLFDSFNMPYSVKGFIDGLVVTVTVHPLNEPPQWSNPKYTKVLNLDTDCGDSGLIPTPILPGDWGLIAAHSSGNPEGYVRLHRVKFQRTS